MSDHSITPHKHANLLRDFDSGLSKLRYELAKNLAEIDVLKTERVENVLSVFNERIVVFQHDFLQMLAQLRGDAPNNTKKLTIQASGGSHAPAAVGIAAGVAGGTLASGFTVATATSGWWLWSSPTAVSLSTFLAGVTGLSAGVVTGGLAIGGGLAGMLAVNKGVSSIMRKRIRTKIMSSFDEHVVSELKNWAAELINE